jgi:hypothetical protein
MHTYIHTSIHTDIKMFNEFIELINADFQQREISENSAEFLVY